MANEIGRLRYQVPGTSGVRLNTGRSATADCGDRTAVTGPGRQPCAEGVGFEPTRELTPPTRFPGVRTRPDYAIPPERHSVEAVNDADFAAAMGAALEEATAALGHGDVPVGAVLLDADGSVVDSDHNRREEFGDPTAHAEMLVISRRAREHGDWRLTGHTLVVTLEPCPMCAGAAMWARLDRIVYGAADLKAGGVWSLYNIPQDRRLNHRCEVIAGVRGDECSALLKDFFESKR